MPTRLLRLLALLLATAALPAGAHPGSRHEITRIDAALEKNPQSIELLIERAHFHRLNDDPIAALADLDLARSLGSDRPEIALQRGLAFAALARDAEAEPELSLFLKESPRHAKALATRAAVRARLGQRQEAIADYDAALELGDDVQLYVDRGRLQERLGLDDDAARGYRLGMQRLGGATTLRTALIRVETRRGRFDDALALVDGGLEECAVKTGWYLRRSQVLSAARRKQEAAQALDHALEEANRAVAKRASAMALYNRARVLLARQDNQAARHDLVVALDKSPKYDKAAALLLRLGAERPTEETEK